MSHPSAQHDLVATLVKIATCWLTVVCSARHSTYCMSASLSLSLYLWLYRCVHTGMYVHVPTTTSATGELPVAEVQLAGSDNC